MFKQEIPVTPSWEVLLARIFGKQYVAIEDGCVIEYFRWRGHVYITRVELR